MRKNIFIIAIVIATATLYISGTRTTEHQIYGDWIKKYDIVHGIKYTSDTNAIIDDIDSVDTIGDSEINEFLINQDKIYSFDKENFNINIIGFDLVYRSPDEQQKLSYDLKFDNQNIVIREDGEEKKINYIVNNNELSLEILDDTGEHKKETQVFQRLPIYNQAANKDKVKQILEENIFEFLTPNIEQEYICELEYMKLGVIVEADKEFTCVSSNQFWKLEKYKTELFLVTDCVGGESNLLHIKEISKNQINGVIYRKEPIEIRLKVVSKPIKNDKKDIVGRWKEVKDKSVPQPPPPPLPPLEDRQKFYFDEELEFIDDTTVIQYKYLKVDTIYIEFNKLNDQILILERWHDREDRIWRVPILSEDALTIKRKTHFPDRHKIIKFEKIK